MGNIIVEEGGSIEGLLFSEVFMALMIFIKFVLSKQNENKKIWKWMLSLESLRIDSLLS